MDLDLSDDQVSLRDGIASMLAARVPIERVRAGFDRALFDDLAAAGVFSLRADGFSWADCVVVFEQLGRFCVPGPLVASPSNSEADVDRASGHAGRLPGRQHGRRPRRRPA
jgi:alkylation response protein AidB-like acyl-CoA dehydrogenase